VEGFKFPVENETSPLKEGFFHGDFAGIVATVVVVVVVEK